MKATKTISQLGALEVAIIGTLAKNPETFRQVRETLRPEMFTTEQGRTIAEHLFPMLSRGKFSGPVLHAAIGDSLTGQVNAAILRADPDNIQQAAEILAADWAEREYNNALSDVAMNRNTFETWREADERLNEAKRNILHMTGGKVESPESALDRVIGDMWDGITGKKLYSGIPTGFPDLDDLTGGWQPGQQIVVGGRPGMGKTRYAVQSAYQAAKAGHGVVFYTLEIGRDMIYRYLLSYMTLIAVGRMKTYNYHGANETDAMADAVRMLKAMPIYVVDDIFSIEDLIFSASEVAGQKNIGLVVVDYMQLIGKTNGKRNENRNNELSEISRALKQLARQANAATMVLSQISRKATDRPGQIPTMADLRDSGAIEADADVIIFPYRPKEATIENPDRLIVEKQRDGETGIVQAEWKSPGFYYPVQSATTSTDAETWQPSQTPNIITKPSRMNDGDEIPF